jgi:hypothetical protein
MQFAHRLHCVHVNAEWWFDWGRIIRPRVFGQRWILHTIQANNCLRLCEPSAILAVGVREKGAGVFHALVVQESFELLFW